MGKIRLEDLARKMGLPQQDLMFKLRSIGVRIEGEDAEIDSDIIQAILLGKKLPQPREVILRDDSEAPAPVPRPVAKPAPTLRPSTLRPTRRAMIQRVENRIQELPIGAGKGPEEGGMVPPMPSAEAEVLVETPMVEAAPVAPEPVAEAPAPPSPPVAAPPEVKEEPAPAAVPAEEAKPATPAASAPKPAASAPKPAASAPKPAAPAATPKATKPKATKPAPRPAAPAPPASTQRAKPARPAAPGRPSAPSRPRSEPRKPASAGRPEKRRIGVVPDPRRGHRARLVELPPTRPATPAAPKKQEPRKPASARGKRRAERRESAADLPANEVQFKEARPEGPVAITEHMTVREFAEKLGVKSKDLIKMLFSQGVMATINHVLEPDLARKVAEDLGVEVMELSVEEEVQLQHETQQEDAAREGRPPVVTVMGHVDHGKTTLLDTIRATKVVDGEAGGITQHIGAYQVHTEDGRSVAFLDTPGHEAFTMMRARGAKATDIVILVVAADDGVMPQTVEAIDHARAAKVPIVVAINKIDKSNANPDRVKKELSDRGLLVEDWGGDIVSIPISALKKEGIDELLEMVLINAELLELKASPDLPATGVVLEARKEIGRGIIATVLVQDGTLNPGDVFVAGSTWGRVRTMTSDIGDRLKEAGPSTPVEVTGFTDLPGAGDLLQVFTDEGKARNIAEQRSHEERQRDLAPRPNKISLEQLFDQIGKEEVKELPVIVKADVQGSVEVLRDSLQKASTDKVKVNVIHASAGAISTNDVILASASNAIIFGFNVRPERKASAMAEKEEVEIRLHTVIYELIDELKRAMTGLLEPTFQEVQRGVAEVRATFKVPKVGVVAGCYVTEGNIPRSAEVRLLRDNVVIWEGKLSSLRRFKDDVAEVRNGFECGIGLESFQDFKPGDNIEAFVREEVTPTL